jgi:hypothetical protein
MHLTRRPFYMVWQPPSPPPINEIRSEGLYERSRALRLDEQPPVAFWLNVPRLFNRKFRFCSIRAPKWNMKLQAWNFGMPITNFMNIIASIDDLGSNTRKYCPFCDKRADGAGG